MIFPTKQQIKKLIHQSNLIEGIDDPKEDEQSLHTWNWLTEQPDIDLYVIRKVQKMITINQDLPPNARGYFRGEAGNNVNVRVGNHIPPNYNMVPILMENFILDLKEEDSKWMHARFEDIHPFLDGNGRTGRMIMWYDQVQREEDVWFILADNRQAYYQWLNQTREKWSGM